MFSSEKAIEAAAYLLKKQPGHEMPYYDLIKFLYLADRAYLKQKGRTLTGDTHWSLPWGPVLGNALDAVRNGWNEAWSRHIQTLSATKRCRLVEDAPPSELSRSEIQTLESVWKEFGHMDSNALKEYTHALPEHTEIKSGRVEIRLEDLARGVGKTEEEIDEILERDRELNSVQRFKDEIHRRAAIA